MTFTKNRKKYGDEIAGFLYAVENNIYTDWTFEYKTERTRRKWFLKLFNGPKENYPIINLN